MRFFVATMALLLLGACGDATGLLVEVTSTDLSAPADVDVLRFQVTSNSGTMLDRTYPVAGDWPHSLTVVPASDADVDVTITVTALKEGAVVVRRVVRESFPRGATRRVEVVLSADCAGVTCPPGVDCVRGMCMDVPPPSDAGVDSGVMVDGGPPDERDAGMDAGPSPVDAGPNDSGPIPVDAGQDGGVDAFVPPVDSGPVIPVCTDVAGNCAGMLVISEFAFEGPGGASDEFVEVYNRGALTVDAGNVTVSYAARTTSSPAERGRIPPGTLIPSGGFYLLASSSFTGSPSGDAGGGWGTGFAASRGALLLEAGSELLDLVGWRAAAESDVPMSEGTPIVAMDLSSGESFERKANASSTASSMDAGGADVTAGNGQDSANNTADFVYRAARGPQSSASPREP